MIKIFKDIISILEKKEKQKFNILVLLNMLVSMADIFSLALLLFVIRLYTQVFFSNRFSFIPQRFLDPHSFFPLSFFIFFFIIKNIAAYLAYQWQYRFVYNVASRISHENMLQYLEGNYRDYVHIDSAVQIRKISQQPIEFAHYVLAGAQQIITEMILVLLSVIVIFLYKAKLFLLLAALLLPAVVILSFFTKRKLKNTRKNIKSTNEFALQYLKEALSGFVESNIYDRQNFFTQRYAGYQQTLNNYLAGLHTTQGLPSRFFETLAALALFILISVNQLAGNAVPADIITIGAFMAAAYKIIPGITKMVNVSGQLKTYEYTIHDLLKSKKTNNSGVKKDVEAKIKSFSFSNILFRYNGNIIFKNFNLAVESADFIGISGNSGKGKTTLVNLLFGFLKQDKGDILINNILIDGETQKRYWQDIAYVKQQPFLIYDSIEKNITLEEKTSNEKKLNEVIDVCGLTDLLNKFPQGIKTQITEQGKNISGGQRQRIAIARALYKDAGLIILDEPFNELDNASEILLLSYFKQLAAKGRMILLITHNQESFSFCNKIVSLND